MSVVTSFSDTAAIRDGRFLNLKRQGCIVDRCFSRFFGHRPDSGPDRGRTVVHLYWKDQQVFVYLDTSGEPLSRRDTERFPPGPDCRKPCRGGGSGFRLEGKWIIHIIPCAAAERWPCEAAWIALDRAPGLVRNNLWIHASEGFQPSSGGYPD